MSDGRYERLMARVMALEFLMCRLMSEAAAADIASNKSTSQKIAGEFQALALEAETLVRDDHPSYAAMATLVRRDVSKIGTLALDRAKSRK